MREPKSTQAQPEPLREADLPPAKNGETDRPVVGSGPLGWFTVSEGAKIADRSDRWLRSKMAEGQVSYAMHGREPLLPPNFMSELLERNLVRARPPSPENQRTRRGWKDQK
jgi:hypothetical protein